MFRILGKTGLAGAYSPRSLGKMLVGQVRSLAARVLLLLIAEVVQVHSFRLLAPVQGGDAVLLGMAPRAAFEPLGMVPGAVLVSFGLAPGAVHRQLGFAGVAFEPFGFELRSLASGAGAGLLGSPRTISSLSLFSS